MATITRFINEEEGSNAIEYGMLSALVITTVLAALQQFSSATLTMWQTIVTHV